MHPRHRDDRLRQHLRGADRQPRPSVLAAAGLPANVFAEDEKLFTFGSHMVGQEVSERFKLTNPFKVPCTVGLSVAARAQGRRAAGAAGDGRPAV